MKAHGFEQSGWQLDDLLSTHTGPEFQQTLADLESATTQVESQRDSLSPDVDPETFLGLLAGIKTVYAISARLGAYGGLWFSSDTQSSEALNYQNQMDQLLTDIQNRLLFFSLWWKDLEAAPAERLMAASGDDLYYLQTLRRFKPHTLSEARKPLLGKRSAINCYVVIRNLKNYR